MAGQGAPTNLGTEKQDGCPQWPAGGSGAREAPGSRSWLHPGLTFFMLPRVTVERALDISRGLRPRNSPIFPSTCTMYLAAGEQMGQRHARPRHTHSWVTLHSQNRRGLVPRCLPDSVMGGSIGHAPGNTWAPLPIIFSSPFPFAKPSKHIYIFFGQTGSWVFFLALKNLGKLSNRFSTRQFQCYNLGTNSVADEKCFPLEKRKKKGKRLPPGNNEVCKLREGKGKGRGPRRKAREGEGHAHFVTGCTQDPTRHLLAFINHGGWRGRGVKPVEKKLK